MTAPAKPLVSVIVPAHNAEAFVAAAVRSACSQTYRDLEVLVVDDGSSDRTAAVVGTIAATDSRVRVLRQPHLGVAAARNRAIRESRGQYIAPLDADDIWFPRKLELQVQALQNGGRRAGLVYGWSAYLDERGRPTGHYYACDLPRNAAAALIFRNLVGSSSVPLIRRECLDRTGLYNPSYFRRGAQGCEDLDLYLRIAERYEFLLVKELLVGYRQQRGRMSSRPLSMARSFYLALQDCRRRRPDVPRRVFRWSLARQCFYLHQHARGLRQRGHAAVLLLAATWFDPGLLLQPHFYRAAGGNGLLRLLSPSGRGTRPARLGIRTAAPAAALERHFAARTIRPYALFDTFEALYERRLRLTEELLERPHRSFSDSLAEESVTPRVGEPPA